jgi:hypothetical protein
MEETTKREDLPKGTAETAPISIEEGRHGKAEE